MYLLPMEYTGVLLFLDRLKLSVGKYFEIQIRTYNDKDDVLVYPGRDLVLYYNGVPVTLDKSDLRVDVVKRNTNDVWDVSIKCNPKRVLQYSSPNGCERLESLAETYGLFVTSLDNETGVIRFEIMNTIRIGNREYDDFIECCEKHGIDVDKVCTLSINNKYSPVDITKKLVISATEKSGIVRRKNIDVQPNDTTTQKLEAFHGNDKSKCTK